MDFTNWYPVKKTCISVSIDKPNYLPVIYFFTECDNLHHLVTCMAGNQSSFNEEIDKYSPFCFYLMAEDAEDYLMGDEFKTTCFNIIGCKPILLTFNVGTKRKHRVHFPEVIVKDIDVFNILLKRIIDDVPLKYKHCFEQTASDGKSTQTITSNICVGCTPHIDVYAPTRTYDNTQTKDLFKDCLVSLPKITNAHVTHC